MLKQLYIENIAVIERADIEFMSGFNVLSGETGAGKSIIIDALNAILGSRTSRDIIRTGQSKASVSAVFSDLPDKTIDFIQGLGFSCEESTLLIKRDIFADGKNVCKINGQPATITMLKDLSQYLVNIHGQHDGQHLLNELLHIEYLDAFAGSEPLLRNYNTHYDELLQLNRRLKAISMSSAEKEKRRATLTYDVNELKNAAVTVGEEEQLSVRRRELINAERIITGVSQALIMLYGNDDIPGACTLIDQAQSALKECVKYSNDADICLSQLGEISVLASDVVGTLTKSLSTMEHSPDEQTDIEMRLDLLSRLTKKYGALPNELPDLCRTFQEELDSLDGIEDNMDKLTADYAKKRQTVFDLAVELHKFREAAAERLKQQIENELKQLDMPYASFYVELESTGTSGQAKFTRKGTDIVRFLMSANSGEDLKPMAKVASGGELSRIMLAIKNVLSVGDISGTSVFDEVDAGVSGRAAGKVGEKLYMVSQRRQVLCVTHLPQIAALADYQYKISKSTQNGRTYTTVDLLDEKGRAAELARLTSGEHITDTALKSAVEMIEISNARKNKLLTKQI